MQRVRLGTTATVEQESWLAQVIELFAPEFAVVCREKCLYLTIKFPAAVCLLPYLPHTHPYTPTHAHALVSLTAAHNGLCA